MLTARRPALAHPPRVAIGVGARGRPLLPRCGRINKGSVCQNLGSRPVRVGGEGDYRRVFTYSLFEYDTERDGDE